MRFEPLALMVQPKEAFLKRLTTAICTTLALAISTAVPVGAAPAFIPKAPVASSDITQVQERRIIRRNDRREHRRDRFERRGDRAYYRGHRGYRDYRRGYRSHNGWWFPPAAFITGAIIGGALNNQRAIRGSSAHVQWCHDRWRSYRASDNTYQPYNGPRRQCVSPYS